MFCVWVRLTIGVGKGPISRFGAIYLFLQPGKRERENENLIQESCQKTVYVTQSKLQLKNSCYLLLLIINLF